MPDTAREHEFEIDREAVYRYLRTLVTFIMVVAGVWVFGAGLVLGLLWYLAIGPWVHRRQVEALRYRLDGATLRIDSGFIFLQRKSIPLDRVTDVVLAQGPLMRHFGVWQLRIQTAGTGQQLPEGAMLGVPDPEAARDLIMRRRDEVTGANRSGA
jgi:membrane protein YdbS with pleckstrin-like domain